MILFYKSLLISDNTPFAIVLFPTPVGPIICRFYSVFEIFSNKILIFLKAQYEQFN